MAQPLHPNLARLAASYDEIFERWSLGRIDAAQARTEICALVARDDEGILWSIDPDTGEWLRRTVAGNLVKSTPPAYGLATPTPHDLSRNQESFNPDTRVEFQAVSDELLFAPSSLAGATRRVPRTDPQEPEQNRKFLAVLLVLLAAVLGLLVYKSVSQDESPQTPGVVTTQPVASQPS